MPWSYAKVRGSNIYAIYANENDTIPHAIVESKEAANEWIARKQTKRVRKQPGNDDDDEHNRTYTESISYSNKIAIAKQVRNYSPEELEHDFAKLVDIGCNAASKSPRVHVGNKIVDQFTFVERLNTVSRKGLSFYEFWANLATFKKKANLMRFMEYQKKDHDATNETKLWYNVYRLYYGSVNIFSPLVAMEYYCRFRPKSVLDMTMGWGGRLVGACALDVPHYIGIDANIHLRAPYKQMAKFLSSRCKTKMELYFQDALTVDYTQLDYDMVLTSPPYYNIERYNDVHAYTQKDEWDAVFYRPLFWRTFAGLKRGGYFCLNIPVELYERVCVRLLGDAQMRFELKKESRSKSDTYKEYVYVWKKN